MQIVCHRRTPYSIAEPDSAQYEIEIAGLQKPALHLFEQPLAVWHNVYVSHQRGH